MTNWVLNGVFSHGVFSSFHVGISTFRVAGFVISSFRVALFRLFVFSHGVISSFRLFAWRLFVFSFFRVALFREEKTKRRNGTNQPPYVVVHTDKNPKVNMSRSWQNQQNDCAPSEDSDQPWNPPSLIRVFAVCSMGSWWHKPSAREELSYWLSACAVFTLCRRTCFCYFSVCCLGQDV